MKNTKRILSLLATAGLFNGMMAGVAGAAPTYFPVFDPFTNATPSGGTAYNAGSTLAGQTSAQGAVWFGIDTGGSAANSAFLSNAVMSYPGLPPGPGGNALVLRNVAGPGARMFTATNASGFFSGTVANPIACYYSMVLAVSNLANLSTTGVFAAGFGDQSVIANQSSQPGTVAARLYFQKVNGTNFNLGISKMGNTVNYTGPFTTNQILFVVVDYEGAAATGQGSSDVVHLWVNPTPDTFGSATQPSATASDATGSDLTPFISCLQLYNMTTSNANQLYITDFRMGSNWSWVTGGPAINQQPPPIANIGGGGLNLSVSALDNGSTNFYQWQFNGANLADGPSISGSGATVSGSQTANLIITNTTTLDAGNYAVIVSNAIGSVTSSNSVASGFTFPIISVEPSPTNVMFYAGGNDTLTVSMSLLGVEPITNYLYENNVLQTASTNTTFTLGGVQSSAQFYIVASNSFGAATSSIVSINVLPAPSAPYPAAVLADNPIGFWPLNEGTNNNPTFNDGVTAFDYIAGDNGIYTNVTLGFPGYGEGLAAQYGYNPPTDTNTCPQFGVVTLDSYAGQIPNINFGSFGTAPSFSLEAWVNTYGQSQINGAAIVNKGYGGGGEQFNLDYFNPGWRFYVRNSFGTVTTAQTTNSVDTNWHHLVAVMDASHTNMTLYVDGLAQGRTTFNPANGLLNSTNTVNIGSRMSAINSDFNDNFSGNIQDVAIYNYALTAAQVATHFSAAGVGPNVTIPSSVTVDEGTTLTVPSVVTGTSPFTYQWFDVSTANPGTPLAGQTGPTLVVPDVSAAAFNAHSLELVVSNSFGTGTSGNVFINVTAGPPNSLAIAPTSFTAYVGIPVAFTVAAQGSQPFSFQWSTNGVNVPGATNSVYTNITALNLTTVTCTVSNSNAGNNPPSVSATLTGVAAPTDTYSRAVLGSGPMVYWPLNEPVGATVANDYVGGHDANYVNMTNGLPGFDPTLEPTLTAAGIGMNGFTTSYAEEQNNVASGIPLVDFSTQGGNAEFSIEAWVNAPPQNGGDVFNKGFPNNTQFALDTGGGGGAYRFVVHNTSDSIFTTSSGAAMPNGQWHHLAGVCDQANNTLMLYYDGARVSVGGFTSGSGLLAVSSNYPVIIGAQEGQNTTSFTSVTNASICQVALYSRPLTANEVAAHFALGVAGLVKLSIQPVGDGTAVISWPGTNGYVLQQNPDLTPGNWFPTGTQVTTTNGSSQVIVPLTDAAEYYRLQAQ